MADDFLHGLRFTEDDSGLRPIALAGTSVIGIIGEAPKADAEKCPARRPFLVTKHPDSLKELGDEGSLVEGLRQIFATFPCAVVAIRVDSADDVPDAVRLFESAENYTGGYRPKILCTNGYTNKPPPPRRERSTEKAAERGRSRSPQEEKKPEAT